MREGTELGRVRLESALSGVMSPRSSKVRPSSAPAVFHPTPLPLLDTGPASLDVTLVDPEQQQQQQPPLIPPAADYLAAATSSRSPAVSTPALSTETDSIFLFEDDDTELFADEFDAMGVNGYNSADEHPMGRSSVGAWVDERGFGAWMREKGLRIVRVKEDGACLFRSVALVVTGDEANHEIIRSSCIDEIERRAEYFAPFITEACTDVDEFSGLARYCARKRRQSEFGNHCEIQAIADVFGRRIEIYQFHCEPLVIEPSVSKAENMSVDGGNCDQTIRLSYHRRNHYNAVVEYVPGSMFDSSEDEDEEDVELQMALKLSLEAAYGH
ncbi:hypothetical protein BJ742DRAFT_856667 [Cladochytrium replicatum]|nr:hypothetical protein BJ742DRAFT_856667 [Cladochytrium replicatum]